MKIIGYSEIDDQPWPFFQPIFSKWPAMCNLKVSQSSTSNCNSDPSKLSQHSLTTKPVHERQYILLSLPELDSNNSEQWQLIQQTTKSTFHPEDVTLIFFSIIQEVSLKEKYLQKS